ncbi:MAG: transposase [Eubacteriaceae bacterium]|nr:transposase [Eubacteriaceae bacterium]
MPDTLAAKGGVLAMDNLSACKAARACAAFLKAGIHILCLPPYSPGLNPTQMMWAKLKGILNKEKPRAQEALADAAGSALGLATQADIEGWFLHFRLAIKSGKRGAALPGPTKGPSLPFSLFGS